MRRAVYPGSFDPVTFGHLDVIERSLKIVDELIIGVLRNHTKNPLFSVEERVKMLREATKEYPNVKVDSFSGLAGIAFWINSYYNLPTEATVDKKSDTVAKIKEMVDKEYAELRTTCISDGELDVMLKLANPQLHAQCVSYMNA